MISRKTRTLTKAELRALAVTPGLMAHRISPDGRASLEQLAPEGPDRRRDFIRRLADKNAQASSEGRETA
jgi:hypothetical protein